MGAGFCVGAGVEHGVEALSGGCAAARFGLVYKFMAQLEFVGGAIFLDLAQLLVGGAILGRAARISDVGVYNGVGG